MTEMGGGQSQNVQNVGSSHQTADNSCFFRLKMTV